MSNRENKAKRVPKSVPKLSVSLDEQQQQVSKDFYDFDVNFILGDFGVGKTLTATVLALNSYNKREFNHIVISRPIVKNSLGFLPGEMILKMQPWIHPIVHNFNICQGKDKTEKMIEDGTIEILPIDFAKGITYKESVVIVDEFTDMNYVDFRTMITRLGKDSKLIFCGSKEQIDKSIGKNSCIDRVMTLKDSGLVGFNELTNNHRNAVLTDIIKFLEEK